MNLLRCYDSKKFEESGKVGGTLRNLKFKHETVVLLVLLICAGVVECSLPLSKECGDLYCKDLEYCNQYDHICKPCSAICDPGNNYDEQRCFSDCQDYIHDQRYLSVENSSLFILLDEKYKSLESDVLILKIVVCVCVAVIFIVVAILAAFLAYFWKLLHPAEPSSPKEKKQKKGSTKSASSATTVELPTVYNNRYGVTTPTPETSPSSVISTSPADTNISNFTSIVPPYHESTRSKSVSTIKTDRASPETVTTTLTSAASTLVGKEFGRRMNGTPTKSQAPDPSSRFRREPSESTLPENCAYDNLSMSPQHQVFYSHHV